MNEHFVRHHSNYDLAKYIAYTRDKTPEQTCDEVLNWVRSNRLDLRAGKSITRVGVTYQKFLNKKVTVTFVKK
ncbi:MAG: hypothetical protein MZV64_00425 [Ignavibacteriales bacterium]|nr:hypothetical protein [Ignavibacteriales bacterium]